jgi:hypothetical protein
MTKPNSNFSNPFSMTIATHSQPKQTKQFIFDQITGEVKVSGYARGKKFKYSVRHIEDIFALTRTLKELESDPFSFVVRAAPLEGLDLTRQHLRRLHARGDEPATLIDVPRQSIMIDIDELPAPPLCDPAIDLEDAAEGIRSKLPPEFHIAKIYVTFSSSQSVPGTGNSDTLSAHVWAIIDTPRSSGELKRWAKWINETLGYKLIDPSIYQPVQAHYTSAPTFTGMTDPLPGRGILLDGEEDRVTLVMPDDYWQPTGRYTGRSEIFTSAYEGGGFDAHISRAGGPDGIRAPIISAIASLVYGTGGDVDYDLIKRKICSAVDAHEFPADEEGNQRPKSDANHYLTDEHLDSMITWCAERERQQRPIPITNINETVSPTYPDKSISLADARRELEKICSKFFDNDILAYEAALVDYQRKKETASFIWPDPPAVPTTAVIISTGGGKSHLVLRHAANFIFQRRNEGEKVCGVMFVPLHTLGDESAESFEARSQELLADAKQEGLLAVVYRSKLAINPNGDGEVKMCADPERVAAILSIKGDVAADACGSEQSERRCPYYNSCAFQSMIAIAGTANLLIMSHQSMFYRSPVPSFSKPNFAITDEDFHDAGVNLPDEPENNIALSTFLSQRDLSAVSQYTGRAADLMAYSEKLVKGISQGLDGPVRRGYLDRCGLTADMCREAASLEWQTLRPTGISPGMPIKEVHRHVESCAGNSTVMLRVRIWELLASFLDGDENECVNVLLAKDQVLPNNLGTADFLKVGWRANIHDDFAVPTLALDATMREEVLRPYLPRINIAANIRIEQNHVYIRQIIDSKMPNSSLVATEKATSATKEERQNSVEKVRRLIEFEAAKYQNKGKSVDYKNHLTGGREFAKIDMLVVSTKAVADAITDGWTPPTGVDVTYFARTVGSNRWQHVAKIILIGRAQANVKDVESKATIISGRPVEHIRPDNKGSVRYEVSQGGILRRDGRVVPVKTPTHPDPTTEAVRWLITEAKLIQSGGRGRPILRTAENPLAIDILTSIPLPFIVDETLALKEILPDKFDLMAMCGFMPSTRRTAAGCYPELFSNSDAVHAATRAKSYDKGGQISHRDIYMGKSPPLSRTPDGKIYVRELEIPLLDTRFFYGIDGEPAAPQQCYIRRDIVTVEDALSSLMAALGKCVELVGEPEWLPGCEPSSPVENNPIDCDPEPKILDLADPSIVKKKFNMNRREFRIYLKAVKSNPPDDDQGKKLHQVNAISKAIGKKRLILLTSGTGGSDQL